jgi:hypothetical protein
VPEIVAPADTVIGLAGDGSGVVSAKRFVDDSVEATGVAKL